jgi:hypothetical protein
MDNHELAERVTQEIQRIIPDVYKLLIESPDVPWLTSVPTGIRISAIAGRLMPTIGTHHLRESKELRGVVCNGSHVGSRLIFVYTEDGGLAAAFLLLRDEQAGLFSTASVRINSDGSMVVRKEFASSRPVTAVMGEGDDRVGDASYVFATVLSLYLDQSYMDDGSAGNPASGVGRSRINDVDFHYFRAMDTDTLHSNEKRHLSPRMLPTALRNFIKEVRVETSTESIDIVRKMSLTEQLWWVSEDMSSLAWDAVLSESYPDDLSEKELPSPNGIMWLDGGGGPGMLVLNPLDREFYDTGKIKPELLSFDAVCWYTPSPEVARENNEPVGKPVFFGLSASPDLIRETNQWEGQLSTAIIGSSTLADYRLVMHSPYEHSNLATLIVLTAMRLSREEVIAQRQVETVRSGSKKNKKHTIDDVTIVSLRRRKYLSDEEREAEAREYSHRWIVRGHMRNQAVGPRNAEGGQHHERVYIAPYIKGPEDKPLVLKDRVQVWRR